VPISSTESFALTVMFPPGPPSGISLSPVLPPLEEEMLAPASTRRERVLISMFPALPVPPILLVARPYSGGYPIGLSLLLPSQKLSRSDFRCCRHQKSRARRGSVGDTQLTGFDSDTACISAVKSCGEQPGGVDFYRF
jgi:hypothetical protein